MEYRQPPRESNKTRAGRRDRSVVLGSYPTVEAGRLALREVQTAGFGRAALVWRNDRDQGTIVEGGMRPGLALVVVSVLTLLSVIAYIFQPSTRLSPLGILAIITIGIAVGWIIDLLVGNRLSASTLDRYRRWVTSDEALLIIETKTGEARDAFALLGEYEGVRPSSFIIRPRQPLPDLHRNQRSERPSPERLRLYAQALAERHSENITRKRPRPLHDRINESKSIIDAINRDLSQAVLFEQSVSISAEWLLDNTYAIQRQIADVERNLSPSFYKTLFALESGPYAHEPRIYELASELVVRSDDGLTEEEIIDYLNAYQETSPLTVSELWALPLMLRVALVESLSVLAARITEQQYEFEWADFWANRLLGAARRAPDYLLFMLAELSREYSNPSTIFSERLISQLQGESFALGPILSWLELKWGRPVLDAIAAGERQSASDQTTIANGISSLLLLSRLDWRDTFERVCLVESTLQADPSGVYSSMEFSTRDYYRHIIEETASRASLQNLGNTKIERTEVAVALRAVELAANDDDPQYGKHVGHYIVGEGRPILEREVGYRISISKRIQRGILDHPTVLYLGNILLFTILLLIPVYLAANEVAPYLASYPLAQGALPIVLLLLSIVPVSELVVTLVNYTITRALSPRPLPKLNLANGIPDEYRTLVGVPTLLSSVESITDDLDQLETRYLANPDPNLSFALLADLPDALEEERQGDRELMLAAIDGIDALNRRYPSTPFLVFCRKRRFSLTERHWLGWERKRGKLEELNEWLLSEKKPSGSVTAPGATLRPLTGSAERLRGVRFVITLDADTSLPHETARRLIGTIAHPLNRPRLSPDGRRVVAGYTIVQPRVSPSLPSQIATNFSRIHADTLGVDPYTRVISDLYQDLVGSGSYYGKGIYDVQAFYSVLHGRFPEATLLSHDLIEGAYIRVGLASDIELFDQFPSSYLTYARRQHRWIRGDWQIANWVLPRVPNASLGPGQSEPNPLSLIDRWKMLDNLRRSLIPTTSVGLLAIGWLAFPNSALFWSLIVVLTLFLPPILGAFTTLTTQPLFVIREIQIWREQGVSWLRALITLALLPHQAGVTIDAVLRSLYRRLISKRHLLEWQSFKATSSRGGDGGPSFIKRMGAASIMSFAIGFVIIMFDLQALIWAAPIILAWLVSPAVILWLNRSRENRPPRQTSRADRQILRRLARETWRYFDDFVTPQTSYLPPDNYQEALRVELAERTSPTNIGLYLLTTLAARDFGFISSTDVIQRGESTLDTLERLEKYEGHLLNWYETRSAQPLLPRYVSTVDSGNLLANLWTLVQGYKEILTRPMISSEVLRGLEGTLEVLLVKEPSPSELPAGTSGRHMSNLLRTLSRLFSRRTRSLVDIVLALRGAHGPARELVALLETAYQGTPTGGDRPEALAPSLYWARQVLREVEAWLKVVDEYLPWVERIEYQPEKIWSVLGEIALGWRTETLTESPSLTSLIEGDLRVPELTTAQSNQNLGWARDLEKLLNESSERAKLFQQRLENLVSRVERLADEMNMGFLYDSKRRLFSIGFNVTDRRFDTSYYDLLASECRIGSLVAVARGDVPADHWFSLGRPFGSADGHRVLFSWSGTMFEYLMPVLLTRIERHSLLEAACREAVGLQIDYGASQRVPWGISEAAFSAVDINQTYQYQAFGVPGLGLKRGLSDDLVIAPYATALALPVDPRAAIANLKSLIRYGLRGAYGFYEAIDFTPRRQTSSKPGVIVYTYMAHHQGMTLLSIDNFLNRDVMQNRFHADQRIRAAESLLFERVPAAPVLVQASERPDVPSRPPRSSLGEITIPTNAPVPQTQLLGNGNYSLLVTSTGGTWSRWRDFDVTRWRADTTLDNYGSFFYLRDAQTGDFWSLAAQPTRKLASAYIARFASGRVEIERRDLGITSTTSIGVSPEDDVEIWLINLVNQSNHERELELTSYVELALATHAADRAHPAFSKMFVETESHPNLGALLARRKPRAENDPALWAFHSLILPTGPSIQGESAGFETDRRRFIGRGHTLANPRGIENSLSGKVGATLDPIFALRARVTLSPGQRIEVAFVTGAAETSDEAIRLLENYRTLHSAHRALDLAANQAQIIARQLRVTADDILRFQGLASPLFYPQGTLRASEGLLRRNRLGQSSLWAYGISGDLPIILLSIEDRRDADLVGEVLQAHSYWRALGLKADLIILNEEAIGYEQRLQSDLRRIISRYAPSTPLDAPGGIFLRSIEGMSDDDKTLLFAVANVLLVASRGSLSQQLGIPVEQPKLPAPFIPRHAVPEEPSSPLPFLELPYFNGLGGFTTDGKEYAVYLSPGVNTPAPWVNVFANPTFGGLLSESGQGFFWSQNSQSNRLLPWSNDPVIHSPTEAIYIRDEDLGVYWTPTASPIRENDAYRARHGQGYTIFEHNSHAINQELTVFVPLDESGGQPVKLQRLRLRNHSTRRRRLSIFSYAELTLGADREESQTHIVTSFDPETRAILARNAYHPNFGSLVAFMAASFRTISYTADRTEFLGRNGSLERPSALGRVGLSERVGAGFDPCAAIHGEIEIDPDQEIEVTFMLGQAQSAVEAARLVDLYRDPLRVAEALSATKAYWNNTLTKIEVETPILSVNFLLNRWLLYQALSCRIWGRSALYQSGGAIGYRDQLQDCLALVYTAPELTRRQILTAAEHQFIEGDVQHWWHPASGAGVRTRITDDLLWLPYAVYQYIQVTGDPSILGETVPFLEGRLLGEEEHEAYFVPTVSLQASSLLEHCRRAIGKGITAGPNGIPLIGTGDWNDGMNLVGAEGKGESVWLGWFGITVLKQFAELLEMSLSPNVDNHLAESNRAEAQRARETAERIRQAIETRAWDGEWYIRAFFDDGTPIGSKTSEEDKIDSLPQSWAVLSGAGDPERSKIGMNSVSKNLVRKDDRLLLLFTPPFDKTEKNPGYIKGYPPGVRENGGQYTHAALWVAFAQAMMGDGKKAVETLQLINPVEHARTGSEVDRYRVEPYVIAADVYSLKDHVGQGGWTWYTGSAGWTYRAWIEGVLGLRIRGNTLSLDPTIPSSWPGFTLRYRHGKSLYSVRVVNSNPKEDAGRPRVSSVELDGQPVASGLIPLQDDGMAHSVTVLLRTPRSEKSGEAIAVKAPSTRTIQN